MRWRVLSLKILLNYLLIVPFPRISGRSLISGNFPRNPSSFRNPRSFSLTKDHQQRPKYGPLMHHPFFIQSSEQTVDVADWYRTVTRRATQK